MIDYGSLKPGVSGMMRVKDDAAFIPACVESCIDALDELVIVYNDCTDDSPRVIEEIRQKYPEKVRVFPYEHNIMALDLTQEEYQFVKSLPEDDPRLLCSYYNFALDKVHYQYAVKIDADQLYFTDRMKEWCGFLREGTMVPMTLKVMLGSLVYLWAKLSERVNRKIGKVVRLLPAEFSERTAEWYDSFVRYCVSRGKACVMLAGINVFQSEGRRLVPLGLQDDRINILPPFNGGMDHVFFKVTPACRYVKYSFAEYSRLRSEKYSLIERFVCPDRYLVGGFFWIHQSMMREGVRERIGQVLSDNPSVSMEISEFLGKSFYEIEHRVPEELFNLNLRSLFQFEWAIGKRGVWGREKK